MDIRVHLRPHLGEIRLDKLRVGHINKMFDAIRSRSRTPSDGPSSKS
ncbi:hypothetical protein M2164_003937 [Streptomyces sp. SAI-208]|nr:hypothetical protein [Streptomyces sp. SAI-208]